MNAFNLHKSCHLVTPPYPLYSPFENNMAKGENDKSPFSPLLMFPKAKVT